jgi:hypothetical protein
MRVSNMPKGLLLAIPAVEPSSLIINVLRNSGLSRQDYRFIPSNDRIISKLGLGKGFGMKQSLKSSKRTKRYNDNPKQEEPVSGPRFELCIPRT